MKIILMSETHWGYSKKHNQMIIEMLREIMLAYPVLVLHTGDVQSDQPDQFEQFWQEYRRFMPGVTTCCVTGNHDFWGSKEYAAAVKHREICERYDITLLDGRMITFFSGDKIIDIAGFMGWYNNPTHETNDANHIEEYEFDNLFEHNNYAQNKCIEMLKKSASPHKILMSHFDIMNYDTKFARFNTPILLGNQIMEIKNLDMIVCGHTHRVVNGASLGERVKYYNCGADYENPKYLTINFV